MMEKSRERNDTVLFADLDLRVPLSGKTKKNVETTSFNPLKWFMIIALAGVFTGGAGTLIWYAYMQGYDEASAEHAPELTAEDEPFKSKPEQPGGLKVPHQNRMVYDVMKGGKANSQIEHLLPMPEAPLPRDEVETDVSAVEIPGLEVPEIITEDESEEAIADSVKPLQTSIQAEVPVEKKPEPIKAKTEETKPVAVTQTKPAEIKPVEAKPVVVAQAKSLETRPVGVAQAKPQAQIVPQSSSKGKGRLLIASLRTQTAAEREVARVNQQFKSVLGNTKVIYDAVRKNDQTVYRIMTPMLDLAQAEKIQQELKGRLNAIILR